MWEGLVLLSYICFAVSNSEPHFFCRPSWWLWLCVTLQKVPKGTTLWCLDRGMWTWCRNWDVKHVLEFCVSACHLLHSCFSLCFLCNLCWLCDSDLLFGVKMWRSVTRSVKVFVVTVFGCLNDVWCSEFDCRRHFLHFVSRGKDKLQISWTSKPVCMKLGVSSAQSKSFSLKSEMLFIQLFEYLHFHSLCNFKHLFRKIVHSGNI